MLHFLKTLELKLRSVRRGTLMVTLSQSGAGESDLRKLIFGSAFQIVSTGAIYDRSNEQRSWTFEIRWRAFPHESDEPGFLQTLAELEGFKSLNWRAPGPSSVHGGIDRAPPRDAGDGVVRARQSPRAR